MMMISPDKTTIGFIGTGVMGNSMAGHVLNAGYRVHVFSRTKARAESLCRAGAVWEDSVAVLAEKSQVVITMVGFPKDVEQVYFGPDGILENAASGTIAVDMTTSDPGLAEKIYRAGKERGIRILDAPVSGGDVGAQNATLSIMAGGDPEVFQSVVPLFEIMGKNIVHQGGAGKGQHTKVSNQIAIAAGMVAVCESLAYAAKAGLDPSTVLESIGKGAAGSWSLNSLGPRMIAGNFAPGFFVKHFIKDMAIALVSAKELNLNTPGLNLAYELYQKLAANGCENDGTQALYKLFRD
jgi:3-hydroxyisobutyrate dehydrogenase